MISLAVGNKQCHRSHSVSESMPADNASTKDTSTRLALHQCCLTLKDLQSVLESCDFSFIPCLSSLEGFRFRDAPLLNLGKVLQHCIQLLLDTCPIRIELSRSLVQLLGLLRLVLHILRLGGVLDFVILADLFIFSHCCLFICNHLRKGFGEICLDHLQQTNNATSCTVCRRMSLTLGGVVLIDNLQRRLDSCESLLQFGLTRLEGCLL